MRKFLTRLYCFLRGHDFSKLYEMNNYASGGHSFWGTHKCMRCGKEENWQYDF